MFEGNMGVISNGIAGRAYLLDIQIKIHDKTFDIYQNVQF
jgi:hypothetical protein